MVSSIDFCCPNFAENITFMNKTYIALIMIALANLFQPCTAQLTPEFVKTVVTETREKYHLPGLTVITINKDEILAHEFQGTRSITNDNPIARDDFFHIGSCSKLVLAVIAGKLTEMKQIEWDTRFFSLFPELENSSLPEYKHITLENLLTCTAGIQPFTNLSQEEFPTYTENGFEKNEFARYLLNKKSLAPYKKGKFGFLYSNASYTLANMMLEKVSKMSYNELINKFIDHDLQINTFTGFPNKHDPEQPWGHIIQNDQIEPFAPDHEYILPSLIKPAGDLSMQPDGFARFTQLNLRGLEGIDGFLSAKTIQYIHFAHRPFSLGTGNGTLGGLTISGTDGSTGTFFCRSLIFPEADFALIIMTNAGNGTGRMKSVEYLTKRLLKKQFNWWWKFWM